MPKRKCSPTKMTTKGDRKKQRKCEEVDDLVQCIRNFNSIYIFTSEIRELEQIDRVLKEFQHNIGLSRIFVLNEVARVALSKTANTEIEKIVHQVSLNRKCWLLLTNHDKNEVLDMFDTFSFKNYPVAGYKIDRTISMKKASRLPLVYNINEPILRTLGMPVKLNEGVVTLLEDYEVCKEGQVLNPSQAEILQLLDTGLVTMKFVLRAHWDKQTGEVERFNENIKGKTKTGKERTVLEKKYIDDLQKCVRNYNSIYVFTITNNKKNILQKIRQYFDHSKVFFGNNKLIGVALGKTADDEIEKGIHKLSKCLAGNCGLLLTNRNKKEVLDMFSSSVYQKPGYKIDRTVSLKAGQLLVHVTNTMEPILRALGMPVKLNKGVVTLLEDYQVCKKGQVLNPSQKQILKLLNMKLVLRAHWDKQTSKVESFNNNMKKKKKKKTVKNCPVLDQKYIDDLQGCVRNSNSIYVFTFINDTKHNLNDIRKYFDHSRIFVGHNEIARVALGITADDEIEKGLHKLSKCLVGDQCGLLLTNSNKKEVLDSVNKFSSKVFPNPGYKLDRTVSLKAGQLEHVTNTMEPRLSALGMPVKLNKGVITLLEDYELFKEGQILNHSQAEILILLHMRIAPTFALRAYWNKETGEVKSLNEAEEDTNVKMEADTNVKVEVNTNVKVEADEVIIVEDNANTNVKVEANTNVKVEADTNVKVEADEVIIVEDDASTNVKVEANTNVKVEADTNVKVEADEVIIVEDDE